MKKFIFISVFIFGVILQLAGQNRNEAIIDKVCRELYCREDSLKTAGELRYFIGSSERTRILFTIGYAYIHGSEYGYCLEPVTQDTLNLYFDGRPVTWLYADCSYYSYSICREIGFIGPIVYELWKLKNVQENLTKEDITRAKYCKKRIENCVGDSYSSYRKWAKIKSKEKWEIENQETLKNEINKIAVY